MAENEELETQIENPGEKPKTPKEPEQLDYKSLYEDEKDRRIKAEDIIQRHSRKKDGGQEEPSPDESLKKTVDEAVEEKIGSLRGELRSDRIDEAIKKASSNPNEQELIRYHLENSVRQTGNPELDVENAKALANKSRLKNIAEELKFSKNSEENKETPSGSGQRQPEKQEISLSEGDQKIVNRIRGMGYVVSTDALKRIMKGEDVMDLIKQGVVKKQ